VWPDIFLFTDRVAAQKFYETMVHYPRKAYCFEFPSDPRAADVYEDRTIVGNRLRHASRSTTCDF
jgi:hypothetical protein